MPFSVFVNNFLERKIVVKIAPEYYYLVLAFLEVTATDKPNVLN